MKKPRRKSVIAGDQDLLTELQERFRTWRNTKAYPSAPILCQLWNEAVQMAGTDGVAHVSQALGLDYNGLKRRMSGNEPPSAERKSETAFVRLEMSNPPPSTGCVVELTEPTGVKMTIRLGSEQTAILPGLVEVLGRQRQ
jgi:hypothetical protein